MIRLSLLALLLAAPLALTACADEPAETPAADDMMTDGDMMSDDGAMSGDDMMTDGGMMSDSAPVEPRMVDGVQVVDVEAGAAFSPSRIRLEAGVPARLVFTRTAENTCITEVKVPAYDVGPVALPLGEPVAVEFTPTEAGDVSFTCGMDMVTGQIVVDPAS